MSRFTFSPSHAAAAPFPGLPFVPRFIASPPANQAKTKLLTCYYWATYGSELTCIEPAVAGRNAARAQPTYTNWRLQTPQTASFPPHLAHQLRHIHNKASQHDLSTLPSQTHTPSPSTLQAPDFTPAKSPFTPSVTQYTPSTWPLQTGDSTLCDTVTHLSQALDDAINHFEFTSQGLIEQCGQSIQAIAAFEERYKLRDGVTDTPYSGPDRFKESTKQLLQITQYQILTAEALNRQKADLARHLDNAGHAGLVPSSWLEKVKEQPSPTPDDTQAVQSAKGQA
ncbi:uncharacterized protein KY384_000465 [Bacidia gigantensis]|uniref:uncharacterized protein n=1 Tax=Bacidia gigantensis TaxID=2732470 RepID=UPI001D04382C|nr:uncharacterized protein KY384_000465 [Bacidia gigantensis]KAG8525705.1 hypothetical protein KY384_000465 [Bacidia gigantensis]